MRTWCLVTREANWRVCREGSIWGLDYGYLLTWNRFLQSGDEAIVYVNGLGLTAVVSIGDKFYDETLIGWTTKAGEPKAYPYRFSISTEKEGGPLKISSSIQKSSTSEEGIHDSPNLIDELIYFTDKGKGEKGGARWNSFVYPSIAAIPAEDLETVRSNL